MSKIIGFTLASPGHINPFMAVLKELAPAGHDPLLVMASPLAAEGEINGVRTRHIPWREPPRDRGPLAEFVEQGEPMAELLDRVIASDAPDFLLVDPMLWGGMLAAEASGLPWGSLAHNPLLFRPLGPDVRGPGLPPPRGFFTRIAHRRTSAAMDVMAAPRLALLNAARSARGLPRLGKYSDLYHTPPLTIATTAEPFEYPRTDWPRSLHFVGPVFADAPADPPEWFDDPGEGPLVVLVGSSVPERGTAATWANVALAGLASEPVRVIAALPTGPLPESVPANVRVSRFLPLAALLPRAACVVCHGGPGTTQRALAQGVPVVAVPFAYDRFEVARRVQVAGAGVMLPGVGLTPARLAAAVREAIGKKPGAERIAEAFRRMGGARSAAALIERVVGVEERAEALPAMAGA